MTKRKLTRAVSGQTMRLGMNDWNTVCDTVERVNAVDESTGLLSQNRLTTSGDITVRNNLYHTVPAFGVLVAEKALHEDRLPSEQLRFALNAGIEISGKQPTGKSDEILCIVQETMPPGKLGRGIVFGPTCVRVDVKKISHLYAKALHGNIDHLESSDSGPVRLIVPAVRPGPQICYGIIGLEKGDPTENAKELFPAVVYKRTREEEQEDGSVKEVIDTYIICPGGRGEESSLKTVHALHVEGRSMSTDLFGTLPMPMNNFDAVLADNGYGIGEKMIVCSPGEVDEGIRYPVQRYDFKEEKWAKTDTNQSLDGCPAYLVGDKMIVAGGQAAYYVSNPVKLAISGTTQFWGHHVTPFWTVDPITGALETRVPRRQITSGTSEQVECHTVNQEKRFMKQNFKGIPLSRSANGLSVEFLAVGGTELLGYQSKAVVTYTVDSIGGYVDCEKNENRILNKCEIFPDTPLPLGECCAVQLKRIKSGNMTLDGDWLVCIGGRYRNGEGDYVFHDKPWTLNLDDIGEGWRDDLLPPLKTPRINAALSEVVTSLDEIIDEETGLPTGETEEIERIFLIGGRNENGLLASIEALNLMKGVWETDWPGLDGTVPPQDEEE